MRMPRRMFLRSATGAALAIPLLPSLLPRAARAQVEAPRPLRYIQWMTNHGQNADRFWPATAPSTEVASGVRARSLTDGSGALSEVLGQEWGGLRGKVNLLRGLDLMVGANYHNACAPTCGSWPRQDNHKPEFAHSVDSILETATQVYPEAAALPALRLTPGVNSAYKWGSFCWTMRGGEPFKLPCFESTSAALQAVFSGGPTQPEQTTMVDDVVGDYQRLTRGTQLGQQDRAQLDNYMELLAEVQRRLSASTHECSTPDQADEQDFDVLHRNAIDLTVAALLCDATRVVAYHCYQGSPEAYDEETFHSWAHDRPPEHAGMQRYRYQQLARLIERLDEVQETDGNSLLHHCALYAGNELSVPGHGAGHLQDMPIVTAGAAGGRWRTGQDIDFGGRLLNNLLVTIFQTMGLEPADYEREGTVGFGDYEGRESELYTAFLGDSARRSPLPFFYTGS